MFLYIFLVTIAASFYSYLTELFPSFYFSSVFSYNFFFFFFFKQKTPSEMRISYWSSDVCSSDLPPCSRCCPARAWARFQGWVRLSSPPPQRSRARSPACRP